MNKTNKILAGVLLAQVALVAYTWSRDGGPSTDARPLFDVKRDAVTALVIEGKAKDGKPAERVELARKGDGWVVASADGYPAQKDKVEEVLGKLLDVQVRAPVATQKANHAALNVGERDFEKHVTVKTAKGELTLVVGGAKGTSVHARFADEDDVYLARGVSAWALSERAATYVDTQYAKLDAPTAVTVTNPKGTINLMKADGGVWQVAELPSSAKVSASRVDAFVSSARSVRLAEPVGREIKPEYGLEQGTQVKLQAGDETLAYRIGAARGDQLYVKADDQEYVVLVPKFGVETLLTQTPDQFIEEEGAPAQAAMPGGHGMPPGMMMPPGAMPPEMMQPTGP